MCFAYSIPYGYTDLLGDLKDAREVLSRQGAQIVTRKPSEINLRGKQTAKPQSFAQKEDEEQLRPNKHELIAKEIRDAALFQVKGNMSVVEQQYLQENKESEDAASSF